MFRLFPQVFFPTIILLSQALKHFLINGCFVKDPKKRPTASDLLNHPFLRDVKEPHPDFETLSRIVRDHPPNADKFGSTSSRDSSGSRNSGNSTDRGERSSARAVFSAMVSSGGSSSSKDRDKEKAKERDKEGAGDARPRGLVTSPRAATLGHVEAGAVGRSRTSSGSEKDVAELLAEIKKVQRERDQYKRENEELRRQLEIAQREIAQLRIAGGHR